MKKATIFLILALTGCSTIVEGRSQRISINTEPEGAQCDFVRQGYLLGTVHTPGSILVEKTKYPIDIYCNKHGYKERIFRNLSGMEAATFGNVILGGGIGWAIDSATGADNKYKESVVLRMEK